MKRGQIYYADLSPIIGSEQGGTRPVCIIQNDTGNKHSPTTIVAIITSRRTKANIPTHYRVKDFAAAGLREGSMVELEQIRTIDKRRLTNKLLGELSQEDMRAVDNAIKISLALGDD